MIPLRDDNPAELVPFVNWLFIGANVAVWFLVQGAGHPDALVASVRTLGVRPCEVTLQCPAEGIAHAGVVTSMFLHAGWGHLLINMLFLWVFGNNVEDSMGHLRFIAFYLLCGILAAVAQVVVAPESPIPMVGASGAIAGVMGAYILLYPTARIRVWVFPIFLFWLPAFLVLGIWIALQIWQGMATLAVEEAGGGVAFWAHAGGFIAGFLLVKLFEKRELSGAKRGKRKLSREEVARLQW